MSTPQERIEAELRTAMKSGEKEKVGTLRLLLTEIKNEKIRRGAAVDEAGFLALVQKAIKQRREAAELFRQGNRPELADKEEREAALLDEYLPEAASEEEIRSAVEELVSTRGLSGPAGLGPVMKEILPRFAGRTDGATVQRVAREVLAHGKE